MPFLVVPGSSLLMEGIYKSIITLEL